MNDAIRAVIGGLVGAVAMFAVGVLCWATPLSRLAFASVDETRNAAVQVALAANLPATGRYLVPDPGTAGGTVLYGRGPVATVIYNTHGFPPADRRATLGGFLEEVAAGLMIAWSLFAVADRVRDFAGRLRLGLGLTAAAAVMVVLTNQTFEHGPLGYALYSLVASTAMLWAACFVVVRWFLPRG